MKFKSFIALTLSASMILSTASASMEVPLFGAKSINDMAGSDIRISMDDLIEDFADYMSTSSLREYFHKDQPAPAKVDTSEAISYLIDNNIYSRDMLMKVSTLGVPTPIISKIDDSELLSKNINRTDAIMYIYKATFGPVYGRTVGVETPNVRVDNGVSKLLTEIFRVAGYDPNNITTSANTSTVEAEGGFPGSIGSENGYEGSGSSVITNDSGNWRYIPQGDLIQSVFGDTNIFISQNQFNQQATGGDGGDGYQGVGGAGGDASAEINYETEYKTMYYVPKADMLFYRTTDVVEVYIDSALSKGLLQDKSIRTEKFIDEFITKSPTIVDSWRGNSPAYVFNRNISKLNTDISNLETSNVDDLLGVNYTIDWDGSLLKVERNNLFESNSGYFTSEYITKLDVYRYIYEFMYASEKKLSDLEADIVNYKYGIEFDSIANEEDQKILKYLIAKGVLNYDTTEDFSGLYNPMSVYELSNVLYRVANEDARFNFSLVQLTDSEQSWKAKGYFPKQVSVTTNVNSTYIQNNTLPTEEDSGMASGIVYDYRQQNTLEFLPTASLTDDSTTTVNTDSIISNGNLSDSFVNSLSYSLDTIVILSSSSSLESGFEEIIEQCLCEADYSTPSGVKHPLDKAEAISNLQKRIINNIFVISLVKNNKIDIDTLKDLIKEGIEDHLYTEKFSEIEPIVMYSFNTFFSGDYITNIKFVENVNGTLISFDNPMDLFNTSVDSLNTLSESLKRLEYYEKHTDPNYKYKRVVSVSDTYPNFSTSTTLVTSSGEPIELTDEKLSEIASASNVSEFISQNSKLNVFSQSDSANGFVSWDEISSYNSSCTDSRYKLPISQISDTLLFNTQTNTYAYFSNESNIALVGNAIVTGDPELGVAFRDGSGSSSTCYYHIDAIRLLLDAKQESKVFGSSNSIVLPDENFSNALSNLKLVSDSGYSGSSITAVTALISEDNNTTVSSEGLPEESVYYDGLLVDNKRYGTFVTLSQSNRLINTISRKVTYTVGNNSTGTAYILVMFVPDDVEAIGSSSVGSVASMQEILDSPAKEPSSEEGKIIWQKNKDDCNVYANWIYGTVGKSYINTGYLKPVVYAYTNDSNFKSNPFNDSLSTEQINNIKVVGLKQINQGYVFNAGATSVEIAAGSTDKSKATVYSVSKDYNVLLAGDRLYINEASISNAVRVESADGLSWQYNITSSALSKHQFSIGSEFSLDVDSTTWEWYRDGDVPKATVVATSEDGTITCQVGPIKGVPIKASSGSGNLVVLPYSSYRDSDVEIGSEVFYSLPNIWTDISSDLFSKYTSISITGGRESPSVFKTPTKTISSQWKAVFTGSQIHLKDERTSSTIKTIEVIKEDGKLSDYMESINNQCVNKGSTASDIEMYMSITFNASKFTLEGGVLKEKTSKATDYISPLLFTSLNDLIVDDMIVNSENAILINEVPDGALVEIGNCMYIASGSTEEDKSFVGYSVVSDFIGSEPSLQDAVKSLASHFIMGNQWVNISHFVREASMIKSKGSEYVEYLNRLAELTLNFGNPKYAIYGKETVVLYEGDSGTVAGMKYVPLELKFYNYLYVYKTSTESSGVEIYKILPNAKTSINGALNELPFYSNAVMQNTLVDVTADISANTFQRYSMAEKILDVVKEEFQEGFIQDTLTLARMIIVIILSWLMCISWVCYSFYKAGIFQLLEAIRNPVKNKSGGGIDIIKIISLGTLSLDSEYNLMRFIQYNLILTVLILIVWRLGGIA